MTESEANNSEESNNTSTEENTENRLYLSEDKINSYCANKQIIDFVRSKFKRLKYSDAIKTTRLILEQKLEIHLSEILNLEQNKKNEKKFKTFRQYNMSIFDDKYNFKKESIQQLKQHLNGFLLQLGVDLPQYSKEEHNFKVKIIKGVECFIIDKNTDYEKVRKHICDEDGQVCYRYNFKEPDLEITVPENKDTIQRCIIQITSSGVSFDYPVNFKYSCIQCRMECWKKLYETVCTNHRIRCDGMRQSMDANGNLKVKECGASLTPDNEITKTKDAFYYDANYKDAHGNIFTAGLVSFENYKPGFYEAIIFKIKNPKKTMLMQVLDVKEMKNNPFDLPEKVEEENYVLTLSKSLDKYIMQQTKMDIFGLLPIKIALILQAVIKYLGFKLVSNIQVVGDASTGKSTILKYYGFLINGHYNMSTNGLSISIPGLRGTQQSVNLMGKENKIITMGYLGSFNVIHIDEAGENKELVQNLKTFLAEENYSYDKAGADGSFKTRTTHINLSENLDFKHLGQFRGQIRKAYRDLNIEIEGAEKDEWSEDWDLHKPLYKYDNLYLRKVIKEIREQLIKSQVFWIDGYDYALHERFPYYFYLVAKKENKELMEVVKGNVQRNAISENMELIKLLKTDSIFKFFNELKKYKEGSNDMKSFYVVDDILESYGVHCDSRMKAFYYTLVKVSRILNKRKDVTEEDYKLLRYIIENTNCKIDLVDTKDYDLHGPPDIEKEKAEDLKIEESKVLDDGFGNLPEGEKFN